MHRGPPAHRRATWSSCVAALLVAACGATPRPPPALARRPLQDVEPAPAPAAAPSEVASWQSTGLAYGGVAALALVLDAQGTPTALQVPREPAVLRSLSPGAAGAAPTTTEVPCPRLSDVTWPGAGYPLFGRDSADDPSRVLVDAQCRQTTLERTAERGLGGAAVAGDGALHLCHESPSGELRYGALRGAEPVVFETVASGAESCAVGVAPDGTVHLVAGLHDGSLSHWSRGPRATAWAQARLGAGAYPRLAVALDGAVHVIAAARVAGGQLLHLETHAGAWRREPLADLALLPIDEDAPYRIALGAAATVHVVARVSFEGALRYAWRSGAAGWRAEPLGALAMHGAADAGLALVLGPDGRPRVLFATEPAGLLTLAERTSATPPAGVLPFDVAFALRSCGQHVIGAVPQPTAEACRHLGEGDARVLALPEATRLCAAGDPSMCFAQAVLTTGHVPLVYRALLAPHEGTCPAGRVCRRSVAYTRHLPLAGQAQSAAEAAGAFGAACERGSFQACLWQGALLGQQDAALRPLLAACLDGLATACVLPVDRLPPLQPDWVRATDALRGGCELGDRLACASVAALSADGLGVPRDPGAATALYARTCGALEPPGPGAELGDLAASLADDRYEIAPDDDRYFACAGLLSLALRGAAARRALRGSAALVVVAGVCGGDAPDEADAPSCAALGRALERGLVGRRDRRRAALAREVACSLGDHASCPPNEDPQ